MKIKVTLNRKFTRKLNADGTANPDLNQQLIDYVDDAVRNRAKGHAITKDGVKLTQWYNIDQDEIIHPTAHFVAGLGDGNEIEGAECCQAFIEIFDLDDEPDSDLPGYTDRVDEDGSYPWTWGEYFDQTNNTPEVRDERIFIGAATFIGRSTNLLATEHLQMTLDGFTLLSFNDLPDTI